MSALNVSAPVYVPTHKRNPSSSSTMSSSKFRFLSCPLHRELTALIAPSPLVYTRDELLSMAPSTSSSHSHSPSSSPSHSTSAFPASFEHLEHTYAHPQPHQGWLNLNTAMRRYLRLACPEIVMNRKMRKAVEYAQFQHRLNESAKSPTRREHQRSLSGESGRSSSPASQKQRGADRKGERASSPLRQSAIAPEEQQHESKPEPTNNSAPVPTTATRSSAPSKSGKRPMPRRTPSTRAARSTRATSSRARYNSFALFHRQLAGHAAGSTESSWRKPVVEAVC